MILEVFASGPADTNSYLLASSETKHGVIIDVPPDSAPLLLERIRELDLHVQAILLTHSHWDHFADAFDVMNQLNIPLYVHREDAGNVEKPGSDRLPLFFFIRGLKPTHFLEEGQILNIGGIKIQVIHTPGHTPGGVCFYLEEEKILFSGDTLFRGTIGNLSFPTARPALMWNSLKRLAALPKETQVYPGHGDPTTIGQEQWIVDAQAQFE
jgi:glyoxylase-like metal-dependent hydrolase (beta-lactamase superfamily II)